MARARSATLPPLQSVVELTSAAAPPSRNAEEMASISTAGRELIVEWVGFSVPTSSCQPAAYIAAEAQRRRLSTHQELCTGESTVNLNVSVREQGRLPAGRQPEDGQGRLAEGTSRHGIFCQTTVSIKHQQPDHFLLHLQAGKWRTGRGGWRTARSTSAPPARSSAPTATGCAPPSCAASPLRAR